MALSRSQIEAVLCCPDGSCETGFGCGVTLGEAIIPLRTRPSGLIQTMGFRIPLA